MVVGEGVEKLVQPLSTFIIKLSLSVFIFVIGFISGKILEKFILKMLNEIELNKFIKNSTGLRINLEHFISTVVAYSIYFLSLLAALEQLGIANIVLYLLAAAILIILLLSFFLAIRDLIPNLISGIYLYSKENLREGCKVKINDDIEGDILSIDMFHTKIKTKEGEILFLPNSLVATSTIKIKKKRKSS